MADSKKVLVVEDDLNIARALAVRLKGEGYHVLTAHDAVQGMACAVKSHPDLILLDVSMPAGNGLEVGERLMAQEATSSIPVIFMTAGKNPEYCEKAIALGAKAFFEKPFDTEQLLETIERTLEPAS